MGTMETLELLSKAKNRIETIAEANGLPAPMKVFVTRVNAIVSYSHTEEGYQHCKALAALLAPTGRDFRIESRLTHAKVAKPVYNLIFKW